MKTLQDIKNNTSSRLMLGTVQFGLNYGIANTAGKPSYETSRDIVKCAYEGGVDCLDTAAAYGDSEEVIGKILDELNLCDELMVVTKIPALPADITPEAAEKWVNENLENSLKRLGLEALPLVMLHREADYAAAYEYLEKAISQGKLLAAGVSGGSLPETTATAVKEGKLSALQIPVNMFDPRFTTDTGVLQNAASADMAVFTRSAYMQGLAVMPIEKIREKGEFFAPIAEIREKTDILAKQSGLSVCELAMRYVLSLEGVTRLLVGVDNTQQMRQNMDIAKAGPLPEDILVKLQQLIGKIPNELADPTHWPK